MTPALIKPTREPTNAEPPTTASDAKIRVSEIFGPTIQGEGVLIGLPTVFVRTGGCDYRCSLGATACTQSTPNTAMTGRR